MKTHYTAYACIPFDVWILTNIQLLWGKDIPYDFVHVQLHKNWYVKPSNIATLQLISIKATKLVCWLFPLFFWFLLLMIRLGTIIRTDNVNSHLIWNECRQLSAWTYSVDSKKYTSKIRMPLTWWALQYKQTMLAFVPNLENWKHSRAQVEKSFD